MIKKILINTVLTVMLVTLLVPINGVKGLEYKGVITIDDYTYIDKDGSIHEFFDLDGSPIKINDLKVKGFKNTDYFPIRKVPVGPPDTIAITSSDVVYGSSVRVTPEVVGPATLTYGESTTSTGSVTGHLGATIENRILTAVRLNVGLDLSWSVASSTSFSTSFPVPAGTIGAVYFTPRFSRSNVIYYDVNGEGISVTATFPIKIAGNFTDGIYELITRNA